MPSLVVMPISLPVSCLPQEWRSLHKLQTYNLLASRLIPAQLFPSYYAIRQMRGNLHGTQHNSEW